ncbi:S-type pyocin domain-containing protein [Pseudomonas lopnurensis]|uniref:S-type pyocin domain-containing protein n=1 Tax=Pseudomonas lopnurensis TaxID=1477517 RepID=UPI0028AC56FC|nr:S-type pyocin domain-containing protein [Pseudomonas lopnurensis]
MKRPQKWVQGHGGVGSYSYFKDMTDDEIRVQDAARRKSDEEAARRRDLEDKRYREYEERQRKQNQPPPPRTDFIFAKSCNIPAGHTCYADKAPLDPLSSYGTFAVLGTGEAIASGGTSLKLIGNSASSLAVASRLGQGALSLGLAELTVGAGVVAGGIVGTVAMLLPNATAGDDVFYTAEQYADLSTANTGVRINVKYLPDGAVSTYGFYTGNNPAWKGVPVIAAIARGEQFVADLGEGIELIWTPAAEPNKVLGIPALEGVEHKPTHFVFPEVRQAKQILVNPEPPPDYRDAIIWFPVETGILPIYLSLSVRNGPGVVSGVGQDVVGVWLDHARSGLGAPIPTKIADKLRGREFSSFDAFRKAFWIEVGNDPELSRQFNQDNLERIQSGYAPATRDKDAVGKRGTFELHHVERIADGGAVYNVDNLRANTPRNHIDIHRK